MENPQNPFTRKLWQCFKEKELITKSQMKYDYLGVKKNTIEWLEVWKKYTRENI